MIFIFQWHIWQKHWIRYGFGAVTGPQWVNHHFRSIFPFPRKRIPLSPCTCFGFYKNVEWRSAAANKMGLYINIEYVVLLGPTKSTDSIPHWLIVLENSCTLKLHSTIPWIVSHNLWEFQRKGNITKPGMSVLQSIIYLNHTICQRGWVFNYYPETSGAETNIFKDLYVNTTVADDLAKLVYQLPQNCPSVSVMWYWQTVHRFTPNVLYDTSMETSWL